MAGCVEATTEHTYSKKQVVIKQGDAGDFFYVVFSGAFEAYSTAKAPSEDGGAEVLNELGMRVLQVMGEGEAFGELAILYNTPRACSVRAISDDAVAYALSRTAFRQLVMAHNTNVKVGLEKHLASGVARSRSPPPRPVSVARTRASLPLTAAVAAAAVPLLEKIAPADLSRLAAAMTVVDVEDGEYIVEIGDQADCIFVVLTGEVCTHR